ncbi:hypothetical protein DFR35_0360 [Sulfurisoma sediminicola]|uniref:Uncharacterized protein n=2 Tax=Sulfurisoma sediminicola TaxID=1381557 RepID=A0A497XKB4_9PROT|nr:hypothetical protein DFR35_0360 [Sulfurisoma sediminicola]
MSMDVERARHLRDKERGLHRPHAFARQPGTRKHREIRFSRLKLDQVEQAFVLLSGLDGLTVSPGIVPHGISVWYEITDYTMEGLEAALIDQGFHLENTLYSKLVRALVYFVEETQLRNMRQPERLLKKSHEVYSKAWDHHPHGDHDDTPADLREQK